MSHATHSLTSRGRLAVTHQESWVASMGTEARFGCREESLASSARTRDTREEGEYSDHTQGGSGDSAWLLLQL